MKFRIMLLASAAILFSTASMSAQLLHTWVSGSGNDNNNCSYTAPCLTFQNALTNTAPSGIITAKDTGDFGPLLITQSVTIDGANMGSISFTGSDGIYIQTPSNVTIQNLIINGAGVGGAGIVVENGGSVIVDNCKIMNFSADGISFYGAGSLTVENSRIESMIGSYVWGIYIQSNAAENVLVKNTVIDASPIANNNYGFEIGVQAGPVMATLQNVTIRGAGKTAVWSGDGVTEITGSVITQNSTAVLALNGATVSVAYSLITANNEAICSNQSSKIRLDNNDIYDNTYAIADCGGIVKTSTTNKTSGTIAISASDVSDSVTF